MVSRRYCLFCNSYKGVQPKRAARQELNQNPHGDRVEVPRHLVRLAAWPPKKLLEALTG